MEDASRHDTIVYDTIEYITRIENEDTQEKAIRYIVPLILCCLSDIDTLVAGNLFALVRVIDDDAFESDMDDIYRSRGNSRNIQMYVENLPYLFNGRRWGPDDQVCMNRLVTLVFRMLAETPLVTGNPGISDMVDTKI